MGGSFLECTKWAEEIYWTHFQNIHFSQFLHNGFDRQLAIPKKFSNNLKKKLPDFVTLKGPGAGTWSVGITKMDESVFFKDGWQEFVNDHSLEENDLLVFKYSRDSHFDVLIFDGQSLCEKEYSYFVKKCGPKHDHGGSLTKLRETSNGEINNASSENVGCSLPEKSRDDHDDCTIVPSGAQVVAPEQIITPTSDTNLRRKASAVRKVRTKSSAKRKMPSPCSEGVVSKSGFEVTPTKERRASYSIQYVSNRRPISDDEKDLAQKLAEADVRESSNEGLLVVMKPSHVYKRFYLLLPSEWVMKYITLENQDLYLRFGGQEWRTRFNFNRLRKCAGITSGWNHFAIDNNLEQFDVCVFEPGSPVGNSFCLDVKVFRVVQEVTPLTPITSPTSQNRRRNLINDDEYE